MSLQLSPGWQPVRDPRASADLVFSHSGLESDLLAVSHIDYQRLDASRTVVWSDLLNLMALGERYISFVAEPMALPIFDVLEHRPASVDGQPAVRLRIGYQARTGAGYSVSYVIVPQAKTIVVLECQVRNDGAERVFDCQQMFDSVRWTQ